MEMLLNVLKIMNYWLIILLTMMIISIANMKYILMKILGKKKIINVMNVIIINFVNKDKKDMNIIVKKNYCINHI